MYEDIKKNKIKTGVVVFAFLTMITLILYYLCYAFNFGEYAIVIALIFSIVSTIATYYNCDKIVLASVRAREATKEEDLEITNILDALMLTSGLTTKPRLYVIDSMQPNAFATGRNPEHAVVCVTTGLLEIMDKNPASDNTNLSENIEMWVKEEKADCTGVAPMECLQVRYQKTGDWELFHSHIEGFDYEPGYQYRLLVSKTENPNPPQDASRYSYKLIQVKEKNRVSSPNAGSQAAFLEKYNWNLIQLNGSSDHLNGAHIIFDFSENRVAGSTGCNRFGGPFEITGDKISFGALFTTKMACLNDNKEREFLALLNTEDLRFDIAEQTLNFYSGDELIAIFGLQEKE